MAGGRDDLIVVNSCAVTAEAVRQTRQAIRRARRDRPDARIMVTGCAAQTEPETFAQMAEVDAVIGNREKMTPSPYSSSQRRLGSQAIGHGVGPGIPAFAGMTHEEGAAQKVNVSDIMSVRENAPHIAGAFADHARAFLEGQNGGAHRCPFCIIP